MNHPSQASDKKLKLSALQQAVLHWLRREHRRRPQLADGSGIPYSDLVSALNVDRAELSACLRRLIRKELVVATLPRGSWVRYIALTDKGEAKPRQDSPKEHREYRDSSDRRDRDNRPRRRAKHRRRNHRTPLSELDT